ncbi:MAG: VOC family protein [Myxococcales bacterium]|nr:VOC family protein [Myxococcales bacterium]
MARVTGIGGVFLKARDPKALSEWYAKHLGLALEAWGGAILKWPDDPVVDGGLTVWNLVAQSSTLFTPSTSSLMINYRVDDLEALVKDLAAAGVQLVGSIEVHENGKFAWVMDPEGNKIELWEPRA